MAGAGGGRLGLRREVLILLPAALMLITLLSIFTLFSYRNGLALEAEHHRRQAERVAASLVRLLAERPALGTSELLASAPASGVALLDAEGWPLAASGDLPADNLLPERARPVTEIVALGPSAEIGAVVAAIAPLPPGGPGAFLRVDLPAAALRSQQRGLRLLTLVVLGVDAAVLVLVLLFLRHLLLPWDRLLEQARRAPSAGESGDTDEISLLLSTFERALDALTRAPEAAADDDIAALQRTLAPSLESGLLLVDRERRVLAVNAMGRQLLGIDEPPAPIAADRLLAAHPQMLALLDEAAREEGGIRRRELSLAPDESAAERRLLGVTVHPLRRDDRRVRGYMVLFADLTEARRQARETQLAEGLERLGEMAAGIAHELRNSLATLKGYLTLIDRKPDEEQIADYLAEIRHEADHLQRVLEDFLAFSRPGSIRPEELSLARLLRRAVADPALGGAAIELDLGNAAAATLVADRQLLERAVRNLLRNAVRASSEAGSPAPVEVALRRDPDALRLTVADRGAGIPQALRERLFQPFASGFRGGVGLGLAITHRIVVLHGGRIRLEDREGGGARAVVVFPFGDSVTESNERMIADDSGPSRERASN